MTCGMRPRVSWPGSPQCGAQRRDLAKVCVEWCHQASQRRPRRKEDRALDRTNRETRVLDQRHQLCRRAEPGRPPLVRTEPSENAPTRGPQTPPLPRSSINSRPAGTEHARHPPDRDVGVTEKGQHSNVHHDIESAAGERQSLRLRDEEVDTRVSTCRLGSCPGDHARIRIATGHSRGAVIDFRGAA
jgi:hypothetical protein